ncbi:hypothetical protein QCK34_000071 [Enterobacter asburiae]|nr:hypothetical protein [Enterobacter asburiae]
MALAQLPQGLKLMSFEMNYQGDLFNSMGLGSYNPVSMRVSVSKTNDEKRVGDNKLSQLNDFDCTTLFHEYIHHLQNVSTITGLQHHDLQISMWHNARCYIFDKSHKKDDAPVSKKLALDAMHKTFEYRNSNKNILNSKDTLILKKIENLSLLISAMSGTNGTVDFNPVKLSFIQGGNVVSVNFGIFEFQESAANYLEGVFCEKILQPPDRFLVDNVPYKIIHALKLHYAPNSDNEALLPIILTALQSTVPHKMFIYLLYSLIAREKSKCTCKEICYCDKKLDVREECEVYARKLISLQDVWVEKVRNQIFDGFPKEDVNFGDILKKITNSIISKVEKRKSNPFIEIDFLKKINHLNFRDEFYHFISENGGCGYYLTDSFSGNDTFLEPNIVGEKVVFNYNNIGWLTFEAAFHYTKLHYFYDSNNNIELKTPTTIGKCPLECYCDHKNRLPHNCTPQETSSLIENENCAYQLAIIKTQLCY